MILQYSTTILTAKFFLLLNASSVYQWVAALHSKKEDEYFTMSSDDGEAHSLYSTLC